MEPEGQALLQLGLCVRGDASDPLSVHDSPVCVADKKILEIPRASWEVVIIAKPTAIDQSLPATAYILLGSLRP